MSEDKGTTTSVESAAIGAEVTSPETMSVKTASKLPVPDTSEYDTVKPSAQATTSADEMTGIVSSIGSAIE